MSQTIKLEIARKIKASRHIAITSHLRPDGDSIYTSLALAEMLDLLGKEVQVVNHDPLPFPFYEFPETARIRQGQIDPEGLDLVILLECVDVSRSGQTGIDHLPKINIDHHYSNSPYADLNWIDPEASAVGEMVYELLEPLGLSPPRGLPSSCTRPFFPIPAPSSSPTPAPGRSIPATAWPRPGPTPTPSPKSCLTTTPRPRSGCWARC